MEKLPGKKIEPGAGSSALEGPLLPRSLASQIPGPLGRREDRESLPPVCRRMGPLLDGRCVSPHLMAQPPPLQRNPKNCQWL